MNYKGSVLQSNQFEISAIAKSKYNLPMNPKLKKRLFKEPLVMYN